MRTSPSPVKSPRQLADEALAELRAHRLRDDVELLEEFSRRATRSRRRVWLVSGALACVLAIWFYFTLLWNDSLPYQSVGWVLSTLALLVSFVGLFYSAVHDWLKDKKAHALFSSGCYQDWRYHDVVGTYNSLEPLQDEQGRFTLGQDVSDYPELAKILADWLVSDKTIRRDDYLRFLHATDLLRQAERWEKQQQVERETGQDAQAQLRRAALSQLPPEVVARAKEERMGQLLPPSSSTPCPSSRL